MISNKLKIQLTALLLLIIIIVIGKFIKEELVRNTFYVSTFGFLALFSILFVLAIPILFKIKKTAFTSALLVNRRWIGISTFVFALMHVLSVLYFFFQWNFKMIFSSIDLILGLIAFLILTAMVVTSNDYSVRILGRNWKRLHYFIYPALILVMIHSVRIGQLYNKILAVKIIIVILAIIIFIWKMYLKIKSNNVQE